MDTNYSVTQTTNYAALAGLFVIILSHFNIIVSADSILVVIAGFVALGGIVRSFINRYQKGDITLLGKRI